MKYSKIRGTNLIWADFCKSYHSGRTKEWQLRSCKATYGYTEDHEFIYLRSYNTIVCVIDTITGEAMDVLRTEYGYTATSAQHISKFLKDFPHTVLFRTNIDKGGEYYQRIY